MKRNVGAPDLPVPDQKLFYPPGRGYEHAKQLYGVLRKWTAEISDVVSTHGQNKGQTPTIAAAATITVTAEIMHVSGTAQINKIVTPPNFGGSVTLIADDLWSLVVLAQGNIAKAFSPTKNQAVILTQSPNTMMWYPNQ